MLVAKTGNDQQIAFSGASSARPRNAGYSFCRLASRPSSNFTSEGIAA